MEIVSYTHARQNLKGLMDKVHADHAPVVVTRGAHPPMVLISLEDYAAIEETTYLTRNPENARRLREGLAELRRGGPFISKTLEELKAYED